MSFDLRAASAAVAVAVIAGCSGGGSSSGPDHHGPTWSLYDPLTATTLDGALWQQPQLARSVSSGSAVLSVAADQMQARATQGLSYMNALTVLAGAQRVTSLAADVTVPSGSLTRGGTATATALAGIRLNYQPAASRSASAPGSNGNFLSVRVELFDGGSGLRIRRNVNHCDDVVCSAYSMTGVTVADPAGFTVSGTGASAAAAYDTTYRLGLSANETSGVLTWTISGGTFGAGVSGTIDPTTWMSGAGITAASGFSSAQLYTRANDEAGGGHAAITGEFGDVWVGTNGAGASLYDDFVSMGSSVTAGLGQGLWIPGIGSVAATAGGAHLATSFTSSGTATARQTPLYAMYPAGFTAWKADLAVVSQATVGGGPTEVDMVGSFLNDGSGGGPYDATGDVRAYVALRTDVPIYWIWRCTNANCTGTSTVVSGTALPTSAGHPLGLGTVHTVLQKWDEATKTFTLQLDDAAPATEVLAVASPRAPFVPVKYFQTQVAVPSGSAGAQGAVEATVKNVWVYR